MTALQRSSSVQSSIHASSDAIGLSLSYDSLLRVFYEKINIKTQEKIEKARKFTKRFKFKIYLRIFIFQVLSKNLKPS